MIKAIAILILVFSVTVVYAGEVEQKDAPLRYFTQPEGIAGSKTPYGDNAEAAHYVQAGDAKIYCETYGEGQPIFVLHGGGVGSSYELGAIIDRLRENYKVIIPSTRGHGRSEIGHSPLTYEQKAQDMLAVMSEITNKPAPILGFSDGAYTSYKIASLKPEAVERIVAIGAGTLKSCYYSPEINLGDLEKVDPAYIRQMKRLAPEPERIQEFLSSYMSFWSKANIGKELFSSIRCPVLLIAGDEDDHAPVLTVLEAHQYIPNSRLCIIPKAWHTAFLDNLPLTWTAISQFLSAPLGTLVPSTKLTQNDAN